MPIVRLSRGHFAPEQLDLVTGALAAGEAVLVPAIRRLNGLLHYYVGVDAETCTMVNVSVWQTEADARQMATLSEMLAWRDQFLALGVAFDRIVNYEPVWDITP
jgi:quinol monooxygenase YgiN